MFALHATAFLRPCAKIYGGRGPERFRPRTRAKIPTQSSSTAHQKRVHPVPPPIFRQRRMPGQPSRLPFSQHGCLCIGKQPRTKGENDASCAFSHPNTRGCIKARSVQQPGTPHHLCSTAHKNKLILTNLLTDTETTSVPVIFPSGRFVFLP